MRWTATHPNRQFPPPKAPPLMHMRWKDLLFMHWRVSPDALAPYIPASMMLETFDGNAWLGVVPFLMTETYAIPEKPLGGAVSKAMGAYEFPELNVRTYVRVGGKPGIIFFSLDAASRSAVRLARAGFRLPYFDAKMSIAREPDGHVHFTSERVHQGAPPAVLDVRYRPTGDVSPAVPGTLEYFFTERYALYTTLLDRPMRGHINHAPWPLQPAEAVVARMDMTALLPGVNLPPEDALCHFAADQDIVAWPLVPAI